LGNAVCDSLAHHRGLLGAIRGAQPPSKNGFSHANRCRNPEMAEDLFWKLAEHLSSQQGTFGLGRDRRGLPRRFKRSVYVVDSTTIQLVANCMPWAKHKRRKAAAKCHLRLDMGSMLPAFVVVDSARDSDPVRAYELCAGLREGEIVVFDKAYVDFKHLIQLDQRGVCWVTRSRGNMAAEVLKKRPCQRQDVILADEEVLLSNPKTLKHYSQPLRRVRAKVKLKGVWTEMTFITNNLHWAASSVCDLYKSRWNVEVFFKELKQNLNVCDFLGHNANAVRWQLWTALIVHLLLRYQAHLHDWSFAFARICTVIRGVLWDRLDLDALLKGYGSADGDIRLLARADQAYLPGFFG